MKKTDSAKLTAEPTTLKHLPPTDEALDLNIFRGYIQGAHWHYSVTGEAPKLDKCKFGFEGDPSNLSMLRPAMIPKGVSMAPEEILKITKCNCSSKFTFMWIPTLKLNFLFQQNRMNDLGPDNCLLRSCVIAQLEIFM